VRNVELSIHQVGSGEEITAAIDMAHASGATALNVLSSPILYFGRQLIMDRVAAIRMPAIYEWSELAEEGGFIGYGPSITHATKVGRRGWGGTNVRVDAMVILPFEP
jgi:putative tryptophan/tyrosine transport system substrate-binding protein